MDYKNITYTEIQETFEKHGFGNQDKLQFLALKYFLEGCQKAKDVLLADYNIVCDQKKAHQCDALYLYRDALKYHKLGKTMYCGLDRNHHVIFRSAE